MTDVMTYLTPAEKYMHINNLNRLRQKKYYLENADAIKQKKKDDRALLKQFKLAAGNAMINAQDGEVNLIIAPAAQVKRKIAKEIMRDLEQKNTITETELFEAVDYAVDDNAVDFNAIEEAADTNIDLNEEDKTKHKPVPVPAALVKQDAMNFTKARAIFDSLKSLKTIGTLNARVNTLRDIFRITGCPDLNTCLNDFNNIKRKLENSQSNRGKVYSTNSKKTFVQTILFILDDTAEKFHIQLTESIKKKYQHYYDILRAGSIHELSEKQQGGELVIKYSDFLKKVKTQFGVASKEYLIAELYNEFTVRDDFNLELVTTAKAATQNEKQNYLIVPADKKKPLSLVLNTFKTAGNKTYGAGDVKEISLELSTLLRAYMTKHKLTAGKGETLFQDKGGKLTKYISDMLKELQIPGQKGAINYLRHMKISEVWQNSTKEGKVALAATMKHSLETQLKYVRILNANVYDLNKNDLKNLNLVKTPTVTTAAKPAAKPATKPAAAKTTAAKTKAAKTKAAAPLPVATAVKPKKK